MSAARDADRSARRGRRARRPRDDGARRRSRALRAALGDGSVRAAEPDPSRRQRLARQRLGQAGHPARLPLRRDGRRVGRSRPLAVLRQGHAAARSGFELADGVRIVPGGSSVRDGAYLGRGVICMPPMYVNIGAYVGDELADRFARAGRIVRADRPARAPQRRRADWRRARAGRRAAGHHRRRRARRRQLRRLRRRDRQAARGARGGHDPHRVHADLRSAERPDRSCRSRASRWSFRKARSSCRARVRSRRAAAGSWGISVATPVIVKYRDERTSARTALEQWIR